MFFRSIFRLAVPAEIASALKILGLPSSASGAQVREAYLSLARAHHPDVQGGDDSQMKVINLAYETLQLRGMQSISSQTSSTSGDEESSNANTEQWRAQRSSTRSGEDRPFRRKSTRMATLLNEEESGAFDSWATRSDLDWQAAVSDVSEDERMNPANDPHSYSRFFSYADDCTIFRMLRSGASVAQVARTLGRPATFINKRVYNAQFKLRVQELLRAERSGRAPPSSELSGQNVTVRVPKNVTENLDEDFFAGSDAASNNDKLGRWAASRVLSALGRNYERYEHYQNKKR